MHELDEYIRNYAGDEARIRFAGNGQDEDFADFNQAFREQIVKRVLEMPEESQPHTPVILLRDLFRAETQWAAEAWSGTANLSALGGLLLRRGGADVVMDFLEGRSQCFDTVCECRRIEISSELAAELSANLQHRLSTEADPEEREYLEEGIGFFNQIITYLANPAPANT